MVSIRNIIYGAGIIGLLGAVYFGYTKVKDHLPSLGSINTNTTFYNPKIETIDDRIGVSAEVSNYAGFKRIIFYDEGLDGTLDRVTVVDKKGKKVTLKVGDREFDKYIGLYNEVRPIATRTR